MNSLRFANGNGSRRPIERVVVTGGAGFIGSHIVDSCLSWFHDAEVTVLDLLTYAGDLRNLDAARATGRMLFIHGDVCDAETVRTAVNGADIVIHAAAESHVDHSFSNSLAFLNTNVLGTHCILEACREFAVRQIVHVSTDEVYGPRSETDEAHEHVALAPTNPYSASKAAAEMLALVGFKSYKLPIVVVRPNNVYGARQYPEKLIPRFVINAMRGDPLPIHGSGRQRRRFLAIEDFLTGLRRIIEAGQFGEIYNVGVSDSYAVIDIVELLSLYLDRDLQTNLQFVEDRPYNDFCYATSSSKLCALGWQAQRRLRSDFSELAAAIWTAHVSRDSEVRMPVSHVSAATSP